MNGLTKRAPALAASRACPAEKTSVILTAMPSAARRFAALSPSTPTGILTAMLGARPARVRASGTISSALSETHSALTGPAVRAQMARMLSSKLALSLEQSEGLVVTPSRTPQPATSRISSTLAESRNSFMKPPCRRGA